MIDVLWDAAPAMSARPIPPATGSRPTGPHHSATGPRPARSLGSAAARKVVAAVRAGTAGRLFPPVLRLADDGLLVHDRFLAGDSDADVLAAALASPRFAPVVAVLDALDAWCGHATSRHGTLLAPGLLDVTDGALFGPLVAEAFTACAAGVPYAADEQHTHWTTFLDRFLERVSRDVTGPWFDRPALRPPLTGIEAQGGETHNGRGRILRVGLSGGGVVAYKPRPADGELLFLAPEDSVFALLNSLPPVTGPVVLPVLRCTAGSGPDRRDYTWQEWIEPPSQWGPIRSAPGRRLDGTRLGRRRAELLWHRAGSLAAAAFRFGITDLAEGNILAGTRPDLPEPLLYPVDLEIFLAPLPRLYDTGLVADTEAGDHHHPGLEDQPRWCTLDGPVAHFTELPDGEPPDGELPAGGLRLVRRSRPCARGRTRTVVADTLGRTGYGPYLPEFLRGMFDAWTLMSRHHDVIRSFLVRAGRERHVRVLLKPTAAYTEVLADRLTTTTPGPADTVFGPEETAQLDALDAPYFFRSVQGGPLLRTGEAPTPVPGAPHPDWPPSATVRDERGRDLAGLGVALRDAVEYVYDTVGPGDLHGDGVHVRLTDRHTGEVAFDRPRAGRRIVYTWDRDTTRIRSEPRARPAPALDVRRRLLAIDRVDAELRARWTDSRFGDEETGERLRALTAAAVRWLEDVVRRHGWPGRALVGPAAAAAACRLLQHAEGPADFQYECLGLIEQAARDGDLPWRQVAYVTDALRLREGRPQLYGTKFRMREGKLEPCPIEQPEQVDERRRRLRMEPLARYAGRLHRRYQPHTG
ncbi:type 2 lantipeptide synthetase LanM [Streptomyces sp. MNU76]|uniref:type 2 lantipeptide synthetase LanM n=1 Tax=Streptomyces sp. MNU76 TaxID=2560026 RepID=UPI001E50185F|nr:type 2 lantipeptide synthetase LanM [Streptomyces sp. MNU76]MCC9706726.1 type 2 lantipeptide synthetase LanM [Streptomyces sp. MNU76]